MFRTLKAYWKPVSPYICTLLCLNRRVKYSHCINSKLYNLPYVCLTVRRPSLYLQDIREIKSNELTYDIPIEPIMKTENSELFKGEYNKFTVAIKKYTYPVSTSLE